MMIIYQLKYKLTQYCSAFQSQLFAIKKALEYINSKGNLEKHISILFSTAIKAVSRVKSHSAQVQQIINEVKSA
jgi:DNA-binding FrmR family transcriptional regulator